MIKDTNKRVFITMDRNLEKTLDKRSKQTGLTKSQLVVMAVSWFLAFDAGKKLGEKLGEYLDKES